MKHVQLLLAAFLLMTLHGCGGDSNSRLAPVSGTVRYNGKPVANAYVGFWPEEKGERAASGVTDANGYYRLTTFQGFDGALIGKHQVMVRAEEKADGPKVAADDINFKRGKLLTPARYSNGETSGLSADVVARTNNVFDFELID